MWWLQVAYQLQRATRAYIGRVSTNPSPTSLTVVTVVVAVEPTLDVVIHSDHSTSNMSTHSRTSDSDRLSTISRESIRKTYILLYRALSCFFMLFYAFSCFSVKAREKYNKSNPPYFSECLGIWLKK